METKRIQEFSKITENMQVTKKLIVENLRIGVNGSKLIKANTPKNDIRLLQRLGDVDLVESVRIKDR